VDRSDVADVLVNFDFANPDLPTGRRHDTTVPQQALFLMNSPLVVEQAKRLVALADFHQCEDDEARIQFLYERIYQRPPTPAEIKLGSDFVAAAPDPAKVAGEENALAPAPADGVRPRPRQAARQQFRKGGNVERRRPPLKAWEEYAHALFQANETSFVN
jgi:hypothetical protein